MQPEPEVRIRPMKISDVPAVYRLMRGLAAFENYLDDFAVTEAEVGRFGIGPDRSFSCLVAERNAEIAGMTVFYEVRWSYHGASEFVIKELFVDGRHRGRGIAQGLFEQVVQLGRDMGIGRIRWLVLKGNERARRLYTRLGGHHDGQWETWSLDLRAPRRQIGL